MYFWYILQGSLDDYNETVKLAKDAWKSWAMVLKFNLKFKLINKVINFSAWSESSPCRQFIFACSYPKLF